MPRTRPAKPADAMEALPAVIRIGRAAGGEAVFEVELADPHLAVHWPHDEPHVGRGSSLEAAAQAAVRSLDDCPQGPTG